MYPVITWNKKHSSEQVVSLTYTFVKGFFVVATFKGLSDVSFQTEYQSLLWSVQVLFALLEKTRPNSYWLWEENLVFYM